MGGGYNYLDVSFHSMAEVFKTRIENLEISIPPSVPSRNNKKIERGNKKRKTVTFEDSEDKDSDYGVLPAPRCVRTYQKSINHAQGTDQAGKTEKVHQV